MRLHLPSMLPFHRPTSVDLPRLVFPAIPPGPGLPHGLPERIIEPTKPEPAAAREPAGPPKPPPDIKVLKSTGVQYRYDREGTNLTDHPKGWSPPFQGAPSRLDTLFDRVAPGHAGTENLLQPPGVGSHVPWSPSLEHPPAPGTPERVFKPGEGPPLDRAITYYRSNFDRSEVGRHKAVEPAFTRRPTANEAWIRDDFSRLINEHLQANPGDHPGKGEFNAGYKSVVDSGGKTSLQMQYFQFNPGHSSKRPNVDIDVAIHSHPYDPEKPHLSWGEGGVGNKVPSTSDHNNAQTLKAQSLLYHGGDLFEIHGPKVPGPENMYTRLDPTGPERPAPNFDPAGGRHRLDHLYPTRLPDYPPVPLRAVAEDPATDPPNGGRGPASP